MATPATPTPAPVATRVPDDPPLTPEQVVLVQDSFAAVVPIADVAADLFYERLFTIAPEVRRLFPTDLADQKKKLMQMLGVAVRGLDHLDRIVPAVRALGARHAGYGVRDEHYDVVGAALLHTLARGLDDAFTPEVEAAWVACYGVLASTMQEGQHAAEAE